MKRLGILISGRGSNFQAIANSIRDGRLEAEIAVVISNRESAAGLQVARGRGLNAVSLPSKGLDRTIYDRLLIDEFRRNRVDLVCLAGYLRLLSADFIQAFPHRILNIHPSLLPAFPGLDAQHQALAHGVKITGCTVHFVDEQLDSGPIVLQAAVPVLDDDSEDTLSSPHSCRGAPDLLRSHRTGVVGSLSPGGTSPHPNMTGPPILIPAYEPAESLPLLVSDLTGRGFAVVIVDDGSGPGSAHIFESLTANPRVSFLQHAVNLGKGAALRTGINHILTHDQDAIGVVTADADGQHVVDDIVAVAAELNRQPHQLVLGVRTFHEDVPFRSRLGNVLTRNLVRAVIGRRMSDTQTGLRGVPRALATELLRLPAAGYEFELDMLVLAKHLSVPVREVPIATVYLDGNVSSHFNPVRDSMKIYFVLFRFALLSLATAVVDNVVFLAAFSVAGSIGLAQVSGRLVAMFFNYGMARRAVFLSRAPHRQTLPRYALLVLVNGFVSYALLTFLNTRFGMDVIGSKISAELLLFCANFALQRDFVFTRKREQANLGYRLG